MNEIPRIVAISGAEAEKLAGRTINKRHRYARLGHELLIAIHFTDACSGCFEAGEYGSQEHLYPMDKKHRCRIGAGCSECGYTGKRRHSMWVPWSPVLDA
jgi:hypothetical protein